MIIEPNVSINIVIELIDAIFDETRFSSIPKCNTLIPATATPSDGQERGDIMEVRRSKQISKEKFFGSNFFIYLIQGTRDSIENEIPFIALIRIPTLLKRLWIHMILLSGKKQSNLKWTQF